MVFWYDVLVLVVMCAATILLWMYQKGKLRWPTAAPPVDDDGEDDDDRVVADHRVETDRHTAAVYDDDADEVVQKRPSSRSQSRSKSSTRSKHTTRRSNRKAVKKVKGLINKISQMGPKSGKAGAITKFWRKLAGK